MLRQLAEAKTLRGGKLVVTPLVMGSLTLLAWHMGILPNDRLLVFTLLAVRSRQALLGVLALLQFVIVKLCEWLENLLNEG